MLLRFFCPAHAFWLCVSAQQSIAFNKCYNLYFALLVRIVVYNWIFLIDVLNFMCSTTTPIWFCAKFQCINFYSTYFFHFIIFCFALFCYVLCFSILCCFLVLLCLLYFASNFRIILGVRTCNYIISIISSWYGPHDDYFHVHILDLIIYIQQ